MYYRPSLETKMVHNITKLIHRQVILNVLELVYGFIRPTLIRYYISKEQ